MDRGLHYYCIARDPSGIAVMKARRDWCQTEDIVIYSTEMAIEAGVTGKFIRWEKYNRKLMN